MKELIKINTNEEGKQLVSARELYLGLGLNKAVWSRWYKTNILENDFFNENIDWIGVQHHVEGNEVQDFAISLDFAKHIAMMARTEKSHEYRNYFIECEKKVNQLPQLSKELQAIFALDGKQQKLESEVKDLKDNMPLFQVDCKELQAIVRKKGIEVLGGKDKPSYKDNSIRGKVYSDIQHQLKREFGVTRYEAIKRSQLGIATEIVDNYKVPTVLAEEIEQLNNQLQFN
ncbi:ORF6C domain-containing protein [Clostridium sp.]|uniref:ORF6C domain-containing protein n=1 Tax=Clostridium sp. TaxID=1506 RepID=UPI002913E281|nr:ORF6C domain-containing protein [Clostridium sp.]MDU3410645.1 ORF6C domain-containing protein [Clostridium sp.]